MSKEIGFKIVVRVDLIPDGVKEPPIHREGEAAPLAVFAVDGDASPEGMRLKDCGVMIPEESQGMFAMVRDTLEHIHSNRVHDLDATKCSAYEVRKYDHTGENFEVVADLKNRKTLN